MKSIKTKYFVLPLCLLSLLCLAETSAAALSEDSLQTLVTKEPENPQHWMNLGVLAARNGQVDLANGYFEQSIKLSPRKDDAALEAGKIWFSLGKIRPSLPYLLPNLSRMNADELDRLQSELEKMKLYSAQLNVLRRMGAKSNAFHPVNKKLAMLAFQAGELFLAREVLVKFNSQLDYESAGSLLLVNLYLGGELESKVLGSLNKRFPNGEIALLASLNYAQTGNWKKAKALLEKENDTLAYLDYRYLLMAMEAAGFDRFEDAADLFQKAIEDSKERLTALEALGKQQDAASPMQKAVENAKEKMKALAYSELYRLYASTGNKFKADQLWESLKEEYLNQNPEILDFLGGQMLVRGYEKQAKYFFRGALRGRPGDLIALRILWEDILANEGPMVLGAGIKAALDRDSLSCEANTFAMAFFQKQEDWKTVALLARNAATFCFDPTEAYLVLGKALLNLSRADEARANFSAYLRRGGDPNRVPMNIR